MRNVHDDNTLRDATAILNFANIRCTWFGPKQPILKTTNISGYTVEPQITQSTMPWIEATSHLLKWQFRLLVALTSQKAYRTVIHIQYMKLVANEV